MKRWPIIRHIRAIRLMIAYTWRGVFVWGIRDYEQMENNLLFAADKQHARKVWNGEA